MTVEFIQPNELKAMLHDGREIAVLDAREEADFATSHLLLAACIPLSQIEGQIAARVPRRSARIVWMDAGEGTAQIAAERCIALGYTDVKVLRGGVEAWRMAGHLVYTGMHVPSKAFAEIVEHAEHTPWISATDLAERAKTDPSLTILDSRSYEEYYSNSIPGATSCPGAELVLRVRDIVPSSDSLVVVNCGGRTRSIIGAQSLINAGLPNPVISMRDGTMAQRLAGLEVASQQNRRPPPTSAEGEAWAVGAVKRVAERFEIESIDASQLAEWQGEKERTLYVVDVRTPEEYEAGHLPAARSVPGGQLVQETDRHLGVWGARVVLTDNNGVRATMTASWLAQMGWEAYVYVPPAGAHTVTGNDRPAGEGWLGEVGADVPSISADALQAELQQASPPTVVDLAYSDAHNLGHIPGAWFAIRARIDMGLANLPEGQWTLTCRDGQLSSRAAATLHAKGTNVRYLEGGTRAWLAAGGPMEPGLDRLATPPNDKWFTPRDRGEGQREAFMREYLTWEVGLVYIIQNDDDCRYRQFPGD